MGFHEPLHELLGALLKNAHPNDYAQIISSYLKASPVDQRIDLLLHCQTTVRRSQRVPVAPDFLVDEVNDCFDRDDLVVSLLKVFSVSDPNSLAYLQREVQADKLRKLVDYLRAKASCPRLNHPIEAAAVSIGVQHACLVLLPTEDARIRYTELLGLLQQIEELILSVAKSSNGLGLTSDGAIIVNTPTGRSGWFESDKLALTLAILNSMQGILRHFFDWDLEFDNGSETLSECVRRARRVQWFCWRTTRQLRRDYAGLENDVIRDCKFGRLEVHALGQLAQFDRVLREHGSALRLAIGAFKKASSYDVHVEAWPFISLLEYAKSDLAAQMDWVRMKHRPVEDKPRLALRLAKEQDSRIADALGLLINEGAVVEGWGKIKLEDLNALKCCPEVRAAAFKLTSQMGSLAQARRFFHLSNKEERVVGPEWAEQKDSVRAMVARDLGRVGLTNWAENVALIGQAGVPWLDNKEHNRIKGSIRKLSKFGGPNVIGKLQARELLFVNHAQVGFSYHATRVHRANFVTRVAADPTPITDIDQMLEAKELEQLRPISLSDFLNGELSAEPGTVFISLLTSDGGSLRMTVVSQGSCSNEHPTACSISEDWDDVLQAFVKRADDGVLEMSLDPEHAPLQIPDQLQAACLTMVDLALKADPNAQRVLLHADPMWNVVPWQYIVQQWLKREVAERIEGLIQLRRRESRLRRLGTLAFWRVPGFRFESPELARRPSSVANSDVVPDSSEPAFLDIEKNIRQARALARRAVSPSRGLLSVLAHGEVGETSVEFEISGTAIDRMKMATYGNYPVVFLHICSAAGRRNLMVGDDVMGAPGEVIIGGSRVVLAPGIPIPVSEFQKLEQYFYDLDGTLSERDLLMEVEDRYIMACSASPACGLYTLYSGDIAPRLVRR